MSNLLTQDLAKLPAQIFLGALVFRYGEQLLRGSEFNQIAQIDECRKIRGAGCLGDIVSNQDDRHRLL